MPRISMDQAAEIARESWKGGGNPALKVTQVEDLSPEFRGPLPAWQVAIDGTTHVYVSGETGGSSRSGPAPGGSTTSCGACTSWTGRSTTISTTSG
jgi:hypothetical protein